MKYIKFEIKDYIARIILNRPARDNVIDQITAQEIRDACELIRQDESVRVVIIGSSSERVFCAGSEPELLALKKGEPVIRDVFALERYRVASHIVAIQQPVLAAVSGKAFGAGLEICLACDIRVATENAKLGFPYISTGLIPSDGGTLRFPGIVGRAKGLEMILTGKAASAGEAHEMGLVNYVVKKNDLKKYVEAMAASIARKAPIALRYAKESVTKGMDLSLSQGLNLEADLYFLLHTTEDRATGINSFKNKQKPVFKGK